MSASLATALEQLDKAIAAVDQAFAQRLTVLQQQNQHLSQQCDTERAKNQVATTELTATITQLETYLGRTSAQRTGT